MTGQFRRRHGPPVRVWPISAEPAPAWVEAAFGHLLDAWRKMYPGHIVVDMEAVSDSVLRPELFERRYEPVPPPDVSAVLGTPAGNAAVVAKLHEMAESVGAVFVPDPDKLARCGGLKPGWLARDVAKAQTRAEELAWPPKPSPDVREALEADDGAEQILRDLLSEYDEEAGVIQVSPSVHCRVCTDGVSPTDGLCPLHRAERLLKQAALWRRAVEMDLTAEDRRAQAERCACRGMDEWCVCQNSADAQTLAERRAALARMGGGDGG